MNAWMNWWLNEWHVQDAFLLPENDPALETAFQQILEAKKKTKAESSSNWVRLHMGLAEKRSLVSFCYEISNIFGFGRHTFCWVNYNTSSGQIAWPIQVSSEIKQSKWFGVLPRRVQEVWGSYTSLSGHDQVWLRWNLCKHPSRQ